MARKFTRESTVANHLASILRMMKVPTFRVEHVAPDLARSLSLKTGKILSWKDALAHTIYAAII